MESNAIMLSEEQRKKLEAFRLSQRLEIHYTPKHGSWINIAEIELSALTIQCLLGRRIPSIISLNKELSAWHTMRNLPPKGVDWHFATSDSHSKLKRLYPSYCQYLVVGW